MTKAKTAGRKKGLDPKRARFVQEYLIDLNATQAAIRAGYSKKTAGSQAFDLLKIPEIQKAIQKAQVKTSEKLDIKREDLIRALLPTIHSDVRNYQDIDEGGFVKLKQFKNMPKGSTLAIKSITEDRIIKETPDGKDVMVKDQRRVDLYDKIRAVETVAKMLGFMADFKGSVDLNIKGLLSIDDLRASLAARKKDAQK